MSRNRKRASAKGLFILLLYLMLFLYTITFSTPVSWLIFYFFTAVLLVSFFSTIVLWRKAAFDLVESREHNTYGVLQLQTVGFLPILLPQMTFSIKVLGENTSTTLPTLFRHQLTASFENVNLLRGHHKSVLVESSGKDLFHLFTHFKQKPLLTDIRVYPQRVPFDVLYPTLKQINATLALESLIGQHAVAFRQLREHQQQDALKDIDWKSSFKKRELMVKEYDKEMDTALNMYFLGLQSAQFEELLSFAYSLYLELSHLQKVQLFLIGEFDQAVLTRHDVEAVLTIQPATQIRAVTNLFEKYSTAHGKNIVVAPTEIVHAIKASATRSAYVISEEELAKLHIGGT